MRFCHFGFVESVEALKYGRPLSEFHFYKLLNLSETQVLICITEKYGSPWRIALKVKYVFEKRLLLKRQGVKPGASSPPAAPGGTFGGEGTASVPPMTLFSQI